MMGGKWTMIRRGLCKVEVKKGFPGGPGGLKICLPMQRK